MVQIITQQTGLGGLLGEALGQGIGGGLSEGLQLLASQKMQGMQQQKMVEALSALGLPPEAAVLPPALQKELLSQQGQMKQMQVLSSLLGGAPVEEATVSEAVPGGEISDTAIVAASQINPAVGRALQSQKESRQRERLASFKETKDYRKELSEQARSARENIARLDRMQQLVDEGKLTNPALYTSLSKLGLNVPVLLNPQSQEFDKLTVDFLRDARQVFGARVTNYEAQQFLRSIPSLLQTKGGKERVIRNLKTMAKASEVRMKTAHEIIKENAGVPPLDLQEKVEERADEKLSKLYKKFTQGIGEGDKDSNVPVRIQLPDGRKGTVPRKNLEEALRRGAKQI